MKLDVLISTMQLNDYHELLNKMNINSDCIIINQTNYNRNELYHFNTGNVKIISNTDRGLSRSRNVGLQNSNSDICMLADDDLIYNSDYKNIVIKAYHDNPKADIIIFEIDSLNPKRRMKEISKRECRIGFRKILKISSVKVTFRRVSIINNDIKFNELFGAGAIYNAGEENLFLVDCLKKKLRIYYIPIKIGSVLQTSSTWFNGFNEQYFKTYGAASYVIFRWMYWIDIFQFSIRKYNMYKNHISIFKALKIMINGKDEYQVNYGNNIHNES